MGGYVLGYFILLLGLKLEGGIMFFEFVLGCMLSGRSIIDGVDDDLIFYENVL